MREEGKLTVRCLMAVRDKEKAAAACSSVQEGAAMDRVGTKKTVAVWVQGRKQ